MEGGLPILERVLTYLVTDEDDLELENNPENEGHRLVKWMKDMHENTGNDLNPFDRKIQSALTPVLSIYNPLRECLLNKNWGEALRLIGPIISDHRSTAHTVFKVGLEVCHQLDPGRGRSLEQLFSQLLSFPGLNPYELFLERAFFVLSEEESPPPVQEALNVFKMFKKPHLQKSHNSEKDKQIIRVLFEATRGLILYAQWLLTKQSVEKADEGQDEEGLETPPMFFVDDTSGYDKRILQLDSDRAMASLKVVEGQHGVYDMFITKYVELLEYRGWNTEAEKVLITYVTQNPDNPNAHRYMMEFNQRHGNADEAYDNLQTLAKMLPSESLVLDLYDLHKEKGAGVAQTMSLLFELLDFGAWQDEPRPWQHLAEDLLDTLNQEYNDDIGLMLQNLMGPRITWWPDYHFVVYAVKRVKPAKGMISHANLQMLVHKAVVAYIFNSGADFVKEVKSLVVSPSSIEMLTEAAEIAERLDVKDEL